MNRRNAAALLGMSIAAPSIAFAATIGEAEKRARQADLGRRVHSARGKRGPVQGQRCLGKEVRVIRNNRADHDCRDSKIDGSPTAKMTDKQTTMMQKPKTERRARSSTRALRRIRSMVTRNY